MIIMIIINYINYYHNYTIILHKFAHTGIAAGLRHNAVGYFTCKDASVRNLLNNLQDIVT